jgi:hypothetical protein
VRQQLDLEERETARRLERVVLDGAPKVVRATADMEVQIRSVATARSMAPKRVMTAAQPAAMVAARLAK